MGRFSVVVVAAAALLAASAAPAHAGPWGKARLLSCDTAAAAATFEGVATAHPAGGRIAQRFTLRARRDGRWRQVKAAGLGVWQTSAAGVARFVYTKTVENLPAPGLYRAVVQFRWLDGAGHVIARSARRTAPCRQPDPRPDLRPIAVERTAEGWTVTVRNGGRSDAGAFAVAVDLDGGREVREVKGLAAGEHLSLRFAGGCPARLVVAVDPHARVDERDEDDNVLERWRPCSHGD